MKPNFLVIGAARSGTTSLFQYLESHPNIFMSEVKEINFFSNENYWLKGFNWYEKHFRRANVDIIGEASTSYTQAPFYDQVAKRIFNYKPEMKLIYVLRDPIDRFMSHYLHRIDRGQEKRALDDIVKNYANESFFWQGCYCRQIEEFLKYFPSNQIHLLTIQDLKDRPEASVRTIYEFLGADKEYTVPFLKKRHNANTVVTRKSVFGLSVLKFYRRHVEQRPFPYPIKRVFLRIAEFGCKETPVASLSEESREKLRLAYLPEVEKLHAVYGVDTSEWRNFN